MKKREQGILTVEASLVLMLCTFCILFLLSFARVYSAQSLVSHAVLQSADAVALESYLRETNFYGSEEDVVDMANKLTGNTTISADSFTSLRSADLPKIAKEKFEAAISNTEAKADTKLKSLGVKDGVSGVDFSASTMDLGNDDIILYASYVVELQFPVFGFKEIEFTKSAKAKTFGDILFQIETGTNRPEAGSASGGGHFKHGTDVYITATPNDGYVFIKWSDGNTDNPRKVTVNEAKKYTAIFEPLYTVSVKCEGVGHEHATVIYNGESGRSLKIPFKSNFSLKATENVTGYTFKGWKIEGDSNYFTSEHTAGRTVPEHNVTYVACYEKNTRTVNFYTRDGQLYTSRTVNVGECLGEKMPDKPTSPGYNFRGWQNGFNGSTPIETDMNVYSDWVAICKNGHIAGHCNVDHEINPTGLRGHSGNSDEVKTKLTTMGRCIVCINCGTLLTGTSGIPSEKGLAKNYGCKDEISWYLWCVQHKNTRLDNKVEHCFNFNTDEEKKDEYPLH